MNFLQELKWRGMLHQLTPGVEAELAKGKVVGYIGFDPTAPSLGIGNYVQLMLLTLFHRAGHQPVALLGGATGRIGDPSGKDKERELKTYEQLDQNLAAQRKQLEKLLDFGDDRPLLIVNNYDFYKEMNVLTFLREVGKTLTINYMTAKESVKKRIETGLSFTEFSYQLLQAYDFQCLFQQYNCKLQMGGSDQWGNITSGSEFIRKNLDEKAYAVTTPLLTKSDGSKFGKSEGGNIWLDPNMTSPYRFYQYWINTDDKDIGTLMRYFTLKPKEEVASMESDSRADPRLMQKALAEELTIRIHSAEAYESVLQVSQLLFNKKADNEMVRSLDEKALDMVAGEIPCHNIDRDQLVNGVNIVDFLAEDTNILTSKSEARRAIKSNAVAINKNKISSAESRINQEVLLHGKFIMVENGKKNKFIVKVV